MTGWVDFPDIPDVQDLDPLPSKRRPRLRDRPLDAEIYVARIARSQNIILPVDAYKVGCTTQAIETRFSQIEREYRVRLELVENFGGNHLIEQSILETFSECRIVWNGRYYGEFMYSVESSFNKWVADGCPWLKEFSIRPKLLRRNRESHDAR